MKKLALLIALVLAIMSLTATASMADISPPNTQAGANQVRDYWFSVNGYPDYYTVGNCQQRSNGWYCSGVIKDQPLCLKVWVAYGKWNADPRWEATCTYNTGTW
jgi:hypothetical protein